MDFDQQVLGGAGDPQLVDRGGVLVGVADQFVDHEQDTAEPIVGARPEGERLGDHRPNLAEIRPIAERDRCFGRRGEPIGESRQLLVEIHCRNRLSLDTRPRSVFGPVRHPDWCRDPDSPDQSNVQEQAWTPGLIVKVSCPEQVQRQRGAARPESETTAVRVDLPLRQLREWLLQRRDQQAAG
ncbi:hypothetical protein Amsp01_105030 [Amycolatopsis sp. NBRC 101858]|nr:hypothetical protein [Amycolatopsis sp. NBRC 101858]GLY44480.1 hypothetical protein Amsp01_105030 [Amycolatopsis sp. NBRC 101858]